LIKKIRPILAKPNSGAVKYAIEHNFLNFWFRFIYKHRSAVEIGNLAYIKNIVLRDYPTYRGKLLEKYFTEKLRAENAYNHLGSYWERDNQNEIDMVTVNDQSKLVLLADVRRNPDHISLLKLKCEKLLKKLQGYVLVYSGL
jgi:uncharacterized protein